MFCYPNAGLPNAMGGYDQKGSEMAEEVRPFCEAGIVNALGGCCGTTPEHIAAVSRTPPYALAGFHACAGHGCLGDACEAESEVECSGQGWLHIQSCAQKAGPALSLLLSRQSRAAQHDPPKMGQPDHHVRLAVPLSMLCTRLLSGSSSGSWTDAAWTPLSCAGRPYSSRLWRVRRWPRASPYMCRHGQGLRSPQEA